MEDDKLSKDTCDRCRENLTNQIVGLWNKSDKLEKAIDELKLINQRTVTIQEQNTLLLDRLVPNDTTGDTQKIWMQPWFKYVIVTGCVIILALVGAAIGVNIINELKAVTG